MLQTRDDIQPSPDVFTERSWRSSNDYAAYCKTLVQLLREFDKCTQEFESEQTTDAADTENTIAPAIPVFDALETMARLVRGTIVLKHNVPAQEGPAIGIVVKVHVLHDGYTLMADVVFLGGEETHLLHAMSIAEVIACSTGDNFTASCPHRPTKRSKNN